MRFLDSDYGEPRFHDELVQVHWDGSRSAVTAGLLTSNDELTLIDPDVGERAGSDFHNLVFWTRLEFSPGDRVELELLSTYTKVENERDGELRESGRCCWQPRGIARFQRLHAAADDARASDSRRS